MLIIGITGTIGAGKGAVVDYLVQEKNFIHYSVREVLLEEINKRGMPPTRDSMYIVANDFRSKYGPSYLAEYLLGRAQQQSQPVIIESIRTLGEVALLKKQPNVVLLAVDAPQALRYERIVKRQSSTDQISYEKFIADEAKENTSNDPGVNNLQGCQRLADARIENTGTLDELHTQIDTFLERLG
jgi:dephospho-CoA kinase